VGAAPLPPVCILAGGRGTRLGELAREIPKPLTTDKVQAADIVITMGCGDACPVYSGKRYLDWDLPDPAGLDLGAVRAIRDDIRQRVRDLLGDLGIPA